MDGDGRLHGLDQPTTEEENRAVVDRLLAPAGRSLDTRSPLVQARVLDGAARLSAAIPPVAEALSATIRRHAVRRHSLQGLVAARSLSAPAAALLRLVVQGWSSVLVSGPPGAGKTSVLGALVAAAPPGRCTRICEEVRELDIPLTHGSAYETRPPSAGGEAAITLRDLIRFVLGMRTELLVVGEVRGAEAWELLRAVNAGTGFACTVHANSGPDAIEALVSAALMGGQQVPEAGVRRIFAGAIDLVVHLDLHDRADVGVRREVREIVAVMPASGDVVATEPIFVRSGPGGPLEWTGVVPPALERFARHLRPGQTLRDLLADGDPVDGPSHPHPGLIHHPPVPVDGPSHPHPGQNHHPPVPVDGPSHPHPGLIHHPPVPVDGPSHPHPGLIHHPPVPVDGPSHPHPGQDHHPPVPVDGPSHPHPGHDHHPPVPVDGPSHPHPGLIHHPPVGERWTTLPAEVLP